MHLTQCTTTESHRSLCLPFNMTYSNMIFLAWPILGYRLHDAIKSLSGNCLLIGTSQSLHRQTIRSSQTGASVRPACAFDGISIAYRSSLVVACNDIAKLTFNSCPS